MANGVDLVRAAVDEGLAHLSGVLPGAVDDRPSGPGRVPAGRAGAGRAADRSARPAEGVSR